MDFFPLQFSHDSGQAGMFFPSEGWPILMWQACVRFAERTLQVPGMERRSGRHVPDLCVETGSIDDRQEPVMHNGEACNL